MNEEPTLLGLQRSLAEMEYATQTWLDRNRGNGNHLSVFARMSVSENVSLSGCDISSLRDIPRPQQVLSAWKKFVAGGREIVYIDIPMSDSVWVIEPYEAI